MKLREMRIRDFGGQNCDVVIVKRENGSKYVRFESMPGYGNPCLEEYDLQGLLSEMGRL